MPGRGIAKWILLRSQIATSNNEGGEDICLTSFTEQGVKQADRFYSNSESYCRLFRRRTLRPLYFKINPMKIYLPLFFILSLLFTSHASVDSLTPAQSKMFDDVTSRYFVRTCCFSTLRDCMNRGGDCIIARHLWNFAKWLSAGDSAMPRIMDYIDKRYNCFVDEKRFVIDTLHIPRLGSAAAPVAIVAYVTSSCPHCKYLVGALYDSVARGRLKNKVTLCVKPIGTTIGDIALMAANGDNKFWNLFLAMKGIKTRISEDIAMHLADSIGIPPSRFREMIKNPQIPKMLEANKLEANRNNVEVTPTFFISGRRYSSYKNPLWVVDDALYEIDRK